MHQPRPILVVALLALLALLWAAPAGRAQSEAGIELNGFGVRRAKEDLRTSLLNMMAFLEMGPRNQILRGQATEFYVRGKGFESIESIEVTPPAGVSVQDLREAETTEEERKDIGRRWYFVLAVEPTARPGDRSVVLVTPQGRSEPETFRLAAHAPKISNLQILSAISANLTVRFSFAVFDPAGDAGANSKVYVGLHCGDSMVGSVPLRRSIVRKDAQNSVVQATFRREGSSATGTCLMSILFADGRGYQSDWLEAPVEFKENK